MNTTAPMQRIQTTCALGIALLIGGTANASQRTEPFDGTAHRQGYETYSKGPVGCTTNQRPQVIIFDHGFRQASPACTEANNASLMPPAVRLARPLSGRTYAPTSDNTRYSF